jgi:hypothetical protein
LCGSYPASPQGSGYQALARSGIPDQPGQASDRSQRMCRGQGCPEHAVPDAVAHRSGSGQVWNLGHVHRKPPAAQAEKHRRHTRQLRPDAVELDPDIRKPFPPLLTR